MYEQKAQLTGGNYKQFTEWVELYRDQNNSNNNQ